MTRKRSLYLSVAAICLAGCFNLVAAPSGDHDGSRSKKTDIGGVVTSPNAPKPGVWVIAETHDLPTRYAKMVVTGRPAAATSCPICQKPNIPSGSAAMAWPIRRRSKLSPATQLNLKAVAGGECRGSGESLSGDLLVFDAEDSRRRSVRRP